MKETDKKGTLIVMCGIPGAGKSTRAQMMAEEDKRNGIESVVYSADDIREELYGDASVQDNQARTFKILEERVEKALKEGKTVYYDTTNRHKRGRRQLVKKFRPMADKIICVFVNPPFNVANERNNSRERVVPQEVMNRYAQQLTIPSKKEGFDMVYVVC